jgi:hypothetical protein
MALVARLDHTGEFLQTVPVTALASLLSFQEIEKVFPRLAELIKSSPTIGAIVQTTLPSTAIIIFNGARPYLLEILCYYQGFRSKTDIERSLLKKWVHLPKCSFGTDDWLTVSGLAGIPSSF